MSWWNNLGLRIKLMGAFGAVLALLAGVGFYSLSALNDANGAASAIGRTHATGLEVVLDARVNVALLQRDVRQAMLVSGEAANAQVKKSSDAEQKQLNDDLDRLGPLLTTDTGRAKLAEFKQTYTAWNPILVKMLDLGLNDHNEEADKILTSDENVRAIGAVNSAIDGLVQQKEGHIADVLKR